jgi:hypothetical protein
MSGDFPEVRYADAHGINRASVRPWADRDRAGAGSSGSIPASTVDPVIDANEHLSGFARLIRLTGAGSACRIRSSPVERRRLNNRWKTSSR